MSCKNHFSKLFSHKDDSLASQWTNQAWEKSILDFGKVSEREQKYFLKSTNLGWAQGDSRLVVGLPTSPCFVLVVCLPSCVQSQFCLCLLMLPLEMKRLWRGTRLILNFELGISLTVPGQIQNIITQHITDYSKIFCVGDYVGGESTYTFSSAEGKSIWGNKQQICQSYTVITTDCALLLWLFLSITHCHSGERGE